MHRNFVSLVRGLAAWLFLCSFAAAEEAPEAKFAAMSPDEIRAFEIDIARRTADLALVPPKFNTNPLPQYDYDKLDYGMTIGLARTPKGRLWACWVAGGDSPKAFFVLSVNRKRTVTDSLDAIVSL